MQYRSIPRCPDLSVSEIALGCEGFLDKEQKDFTALLSRSLELGFNFLDMYTPNPDFRDHLGAALRGRRERIVLQGHICSAWENGQYLRTRDVDKARAAFEDQLRRIGTDYMDVGMIHYVDSEADLEEVMGGRILEYCRQLKAEGKIRCVGLSSHNPVVAQKAVESGEIDVLMFSVNAAYDMQPPSEDVEQLWNPDNYAHVLHNVAPERQKLYETCAREGVAIDVMKAFGGGDMLDAELSPFGVAFNEYQCLEYCLTRPAVVAVMAGCHSVEEAERLASYYEQTRETRDYSLVLSRMEKFQFRGNCMYCGHCAPCPMGISVADVNKYLNLSLAQKGVPETVREHYALLPHHAGECVQCGSCERNCPFGVGVIEKMQKAAEVFGY